VEAVRGNSNLFGKISEIQVHQKKVSTVVDDNDKRQFVLFFGGK
jgi:hypothetical protein